MKRESELWRDAARIIAEAPDWWRPYGLRTAFEAAHEDAKLSEPPPRPGVYGDACDRVAIHWTNASVGLSARYEREDRVMAALFLALEAEDDEQRRTLAGIA